MSIVIAVLFLVGLCFSGQMFEVLSVGTPKCKGWSVEHGRWVSAYDVLFFNVCVVSLFGEKDRIKFFLVLPGLIFQAITPPEALPEYYPTYGMTQYEYDNRKK